MIGKILIGLWMSIHLVITVALPKRKKRKGKLPEGMKLSNAFFIGTPEYEYFSNVTANTLLGKERVDKIKNFWDGLFDKVERRLKKK